MKPFKYVAILFFACAQVVAADSLKFAYLAPDSISPVNAAIFNGMKAALAELGTRYSKTFEAVYIDAGNSPKMQIKQLGGAFIDNMRGALIFPINSGSGYADKIAEVAKGGFETVAVGRDIPESKRLCFVGTDPAKLTDEILAAVNRLSKGKKFELCCYFKSDASVRRIGISDTATLSQMLSPSLTYPLFEKIVKSQNVVKFQIIALDYYSVYARSNSVEIMRRDDYGEIFFSPYLFADISPIRDDVDRLFSICVGALPQLAAYLEYGSISACIFDDYFGWGYFAARALVEKTVDGANPSKKIRLLPPLVSSPKSVGAFRSDWIRWTQ